MSCVALRTDSEDQWWSVYDKEEQFRELTVVFRDFAWDHHRTSEAESGRQENSSWSECEQDSLNGSERWENPRRSRLFFLMLLDVIAMIELGILL